MICLQHGLLLDAFENRSLNWFGYFWFFSSNEHLYTEVTLGLPLSHSKTGISWVGIKTVKKQN